jgi:hypothetical protein
MWTLCDLSKSLKRTGKKGLSIIETGFEVRCSIQLSYGCINLMVLDTMFPNRGQWLYKKEQMLYRTAIRMCFPNHLVSGTVQPIDSAWVRK